MRTLLVLAVLAFALPLHAAGTGPVRPFEAKARSGGRNAIDVAVGKELRKRNIKPANPCSDAVFVRRVHFDMIGTLPEPAAVLAFMKDRRRNKREKLIDALFLREEFADYWSLKWCDLLRVKAEFPINLWPNAVQAYHRWIRDSIRENRPYDEFARALLTSSGSNFRVPPVNFWRAIQSHEPEALAQAAALTFMGVRFESFSEETRAGMTAFFSRVSFKRTVEWKEEIVFLNPAPAGALRAVFPDGTPAMIAADEDPRHVFADWLITPENPWFTKSVVNRVWAWLVGRGVINETDDIRPDNPPSNPALLETLRKEFVKADYDLRKLMKLILTSSTYQQSAIPKSDHREAERLFAHYVVRRLDAEVLIDALQKITGSSEKYWSAIPEPFTYVPRDQRSIALSDGSITSPFLEMFGRPARDTGLESERNNRTTNGQRLHLLNSTDIQRRIERSVKLGKYLRGKAGKPRDAIIGLFLMIVSREPTDEELAAITEYAKTAKVSPKQAADDIVWALINTKEFLYRH